MNHLTYFGLFTWYPSLYDCLIRELREEVGIEVTYINKRPSYFVTALNINGQWKSNVLYETKIKDLKFTPSDECVDMRFFTKEEALKEKIYPVVREFIKEYDPANHEPK
ncbi:MAG: NUDIX hydrolase [Patescibacteria group bacterium]